MRIEPPTRPQARLSSDRRVRERALKPGRTPDRGDAEYRKSPPANDRPDAQTGARGIVVVSVSDQERSQQLRPGRWRSHVPFIAQYIGQETSSETPERYVRRHSETARKAYDKQAVYTPHSRTVARV